MNIETLKKIKACFEQNVKHGNLQLASFIFPVPAAKQSLKDLIGMNEAAIELINQEIEAIRMEITL